MCACVCENKNLNSGVFLYSTPPFCRVFFCFVLRQGLFLKVELANSAGLGGLQDLVTPVSICPL